MIVFLGIALLASGAAPAQSVDSRIAALEAEVQHSEDEEAVRRVAYSYAYYMDNAMPDQVLSLISDHADYCEISGYGLFRGKAGCAKIWNGILGPALTDGGPGLKYGRFIKHYMLKGIVEVAPDGKTATSRHDYFGLSASLGGRRATSHQIGVYRFTYAKEDGVWRITRFELSFDASNWGTAAFPTRPVLRCPGPSWPTPDDPPLYYHPFPETGAAPFEQRNPVTDRPIRTVTGKRHHFVGNWPGEWGRPCGTATPAAKPGDN